MSDLKFGLRQLAKNPGVTCVAVLTLGLVIGVLGVIFAAVNYLLFRPLPVQEPERVVKVWRSDETRSEGSFQQGPLFAAYQEQGSPFDAFAGIRMGTMTLTENAEPDHMSVAFVSPSFFEIFQTPAMLGQTFSQDRSADYQARQVVLNYWCWEHDFHSDMEIIGKTILLNQLAHIVVGIMPRDFTRIESAYGVELFVPHDFTRAENTWSNFEVIARLKPNVSREQATTPLGAIAQHIERELAPQSQFDRVHLAPYFRLEFQSDEILMTTFFIAIVLFVLLIACSNLTNLLLARSFARSRELATRLSLGATRGRLLRQLFVEFALLGLFGGLVGLVLAAWTSAIFISNHADLAFDWRVCAFTTAIGLLSGLLAGLAPALRFSCPDIVSSLKDGSVASGIGPKHNRLRNILVTTQIAMVVVLLVSSGLMIRSILNLRSAQPGYETSQLAFLSVYLKDEEHPTEEARQSYTQGALTALRTLPGIEQAEVATTGATVRYSGLRPFGIQGRAPESGNWNPRAAQNAVTAGYFDLINANIVRGRIFTEQETQANTALAVINESLRKKYFSNEDPTGQFISLQIGDNKKKVFEIVGVI